MKNVIHEIDSQNELVLLSASFTAKVDVLLSEHWKMLFLRSFILNPKERG